MASNSRFCGASSSKTASAEYASIAARYWLRSGHEIHSSAYYTPFPPARRRLPFISLTISCSALVEQSRCRTLPEPFLPETASSDCLKRDISLLQLRGRSPPAAAMEVFKALGFFTHVCIPPVSASTQAIRLPLLRLTRESYLPAARLTHGADSAPSGPLTMP